MDNPLELILREAANLPDGPAWIRGAFIKRLVHALIRDRVRVGTGLNESPTDRGRFFHAQGGTDAAVAGATCWEPIAASAGGLDFALRPGYVWDGNRLWEPSNANAVFTVPANCTAGYYAWLDATVDPSSATISALAYDSGTTLPSAVSDVTDGSGDVPAHAYALLCMVTSTATTVELSAAAQFLQTPLQLTPSVIDLTIDGTTRRMQWQTFDLATLA